MKTKQIFLLFLFVGYAFCLQGQQSESMKIKGSIDASYFMPMSGIDVSLPGAGLRGGMVFSEKSYIYGGYHYYFPATQQDEVLADAHSNQTSPSQIEVMTTKEIGLHNVFLGGRYFFGNSARSKTRFYFVGELGGVFGKETTIETENYDEDAYYMQNESNEEGNSLNFSVIMADLGGGLEVKAGPGTFFIEGKIASGSINRNSSTGSSNFGSSSTSGTDRETLLLLILDAGYSFSLGI